MNDKLKAPVRQLFSMVELYNGSTLENIFFYNSNLISWSVERVGEDTKFFGYGICQKCNVKVIDPEGLLDITTEHYLNIVPGVITGKDEYGNVIDYTDAFPWFKVSEVHRDKTTNELSITGYDLLDQTTKLPIPEDIVTNGTSVDAIIEPACAALSEHSRLEISCECPFSDWDWMLANGGNYEGTEKLRDALDDLAEVLNCIYYLDAGNTLRFVRLSNDAETHYIDKSLYFDFNASTNRRLSKLCRATELGNNVDIDTGVSGTTQYIRDNGFLELDDNIAEVLQEMINTVGGLTIGQFELTWRGNFLYKIGDRIEMEGRNTENIYSFILNDTIEYDGSLTQKTQWHYTASETEDASNPSTVGEILKQTYARVDKVNKEISLVVSDKDAMNDKITQIQLTTDNITSSVQRIETNTNNSIDAIEEELQTIRNKVETTLSAEDIQIKIEEEISNIEGVDSITTTTGFTFNEDGLTIQKSDSEMSTIVTEDGMIVYKNGNEVLKANNQGVDAANLHATTYLIIGMNSRFEDYNNNTRTGCFWIGS